MKLLMIDNYDSFTWNIVQYFGELGAQVEVFRNDEITVEGIAERAPDRLVVSPGIDLIWDSVEGYSEELSQTAPHAWKAGEQTKILKAGVDAIENGQQILMVAPPNPYRCPPGPYERASMMAHVLKSKGLTDAKIIILDPKDKFSKQGVFQEGWEKYYPGMIEWYGPDVHGGIESIDVKAGTVETGLDTFKGAFMNVIPAQKAGAIAAALSDAGALETRAERLKERVHRLFNADDMCDRILEFYGQAMASGR